jgi:hypothetical protein
MSSIYRLSVFWAAVFIVVAWLLPNHTIPWLTAYQDFSAFFALFLLSSYLFKSKSGVGFTGPMLCVFLFSFLPIINFLLGSGFFLGDSLMAAIYILGFSVAILAGFNLGRESPSSACLWLSCALLFASVVSCFIAISQWLGLFAGMWIVDINFGGRPYANIAQPNNLATLLCMGLGGAIYLFEKRILGGGVGGLVAFLLIFGVVLTQSRTPWVGALFALIWWWWKGGQFRFRFLHMAGWVLVYVGLTVGYPVLSEGLGMLSPGLLERAIQSQRLGLWSQFLFAIYDGPLWGYGWGQVSVAQALISLERPFPLPTEHAHNIILDLLLWCGPLLGGIVVLSLTLWLVKMALKAKRNESVVLLLMVGFVLIHGMLEFPLEYAFFLLPVGFMLGVVVSETEATVGQVPQLLFGGFWLSCLMLFFLVWYEYRKVEEDYRLMRFEDLNIGTLKADWDAPDVIVLSGLRELIRFSRFDYTKAMGDDELMWMRNVAYRNAYSYTLFRYAVALAVNGRPDQAGVELERLRALHGELGYGRALNSLEALAKKKPALKLVPIKP